MKTGAATPKQRVTPVVRHKKTLLPDNGGPRNVGTDVKALEDAASRVMNQHFLDSITTFAHALEEDLDGKATVYCHGGYALRRYVENAGLLGFLREGAEAVAANDDSVVGRVLESAVEDPRDIDLVVIPHKPIACDTLQKCTRDAVVGPVGRHLRELRRHIHNALASEERRESIKGEISVEFPSDTIHLTNTAHVHLQNDAKQNGSPVRVVRNIQPRMQDGECENKIKELPEQTGSNISRSNKQSPAQCYPLRDSLNMLISFTTGFDAMASTNAFHLMRLGLGVQAAAPSGEGKPVSAIANFLDISIPKSDDHKYQHGSRAGFDGIVYDQTDDGIPFPGLAYVLDNTMHQYSSYAVSGVPALEAKAERLLYRIVLIYLLHVLTDTERSVSASTVASRGNNIGSLIEEAKAVMFGMAGDGAKGVWMDILSQLPWYDRDEQKALANFLQDRTSRMLVAVHAGELVPKHTGRAESAVPSMGRFPSTLVSARGGGDASKKKKPRSKKSHDKN